MSRSSALDELSRLLRGEALLQPNWTSIIDLANRALVTPRLEPVLEKADAPADVVAFVGEVSQRNRLRNERLYVQLGEAAIALNNVGVTPLVLKGGACLVRSEGRCPRMISDIDLLVPSSQVALVLAALQDAGFKVLEQYGRQDHAVAVLGRAQDVGQLDLHQRPPGPPVFFQSLDFTSLSEIANVGDGQVRTPLPHVDIYLQVLHDQFHDGALWRGGFDLRHAWDIADLIGSNPSVDWNQVILLPFTELSLRALAIHLQTCHLLTGAEIPSQFNSWSVRLQAGRQRLQYDVPVLQLPLAILGIYIECNRLLRHRSFMQTYANETECTPGYNYARRSLGRLLQILRERPMASL